MGEVVAVMILKNLYFALEDLCCGRFLYGMSSLTIDIPFLDVLPDLPF